MSNAYDQFSLFWHENAYSKYYQEIKTIFMNIQKEGHQLQMHLYMYKYISVQFENLDFNLENNKNNNNIWIFLFLTRRESRGKATRTNEVNDVKEHFVTVS